MTFRRRKKMIGVYVLWEIKKKKSDWQSSAREEERWRETLEGTSLF